MSIKNNFVQIFAFLVFLWLVFLLQVSGIINTADYVISKSNTIFSIITGVFLHGNYDHLVGNTRILLVVLPLLFWLYPKTKYRLIALGIVIPSAVCYIFGISALGISGLAFCLLWFLVFRGLRSNNLIKFAVGIILVMIYSSTLIGITPAAGLKIAWQAHLAGFLVGLDAALFRKED